MTAPATERGFDWEAAGQGLGESLNLHHAIVVAGHNPDQTGQVALGIARAQSAHRRVTLGDLFADSPPIQRLVHDDDAHGLVEAISYGMSLARVTRPVAGSTRLFVIPSGSEPPDYDELLSNPRWARVASEARASDSLLILIAPAGAHGIAELVALTDGVVVVGDAVPAGVEASSVVAMLRESRPAAARAGEQRASRAAPAKRRQFKVNSMPGIALLSLLVILVGWLAYRPLAGGPAHLGPKPDTVNHRVIPAPIAVQPATPRRRRHGGDRHPVFGGESVRLHVVRRVRGRIGCRKYAVRRYFEAATRRQQRPDGNLLAGAGAGCDVVQGGQRRVRDASASRLAASRAEATQAP